MKRSPSRDLVLATLAGSLLAASSLLACGSHSAGFGASSAEKNNAIRSTEIVHEPCDIESKEATKTDVNGDSKPDIVSVKSGGREVCRAVDLNFDGRFDTFVYLDASGQERRRESDFDRDGVLDEIATIQNGVIVSKERETNLDGKLDTWDTYVGGKLSQRVRDTTGDGQLDQWWEFPDPNRLDCPVIATDQDGDGRPDTRQDVCKESEGEKPPATPSATPPTPATPPAPAASAIPAASSAQPSAPPAPSGSAAPAGKGGTP